MEWFLALGSILLLDLILSGDNAIMIALACKNLPDRLRKKAMFVGCFGAVFIRVVLTLFATSLLAIQYLQFFGGIALLFIAVKLLIQHDADEEGSGEKPHSFAAAIRTILIADVIMSLDNILSMAGVAQTVDEGRWSLIVIGLMASIPLVLCGSQLFLVLMRRFGAIVYLGAGILAFTAGKMMATDRALGHYMTNVAGYMETALVLIVVASGYFYNKRRKQVNS